MKAQKRDDGKYQCPECDYGHDEGRSRQAVTKHYNKHHLKESEKSASEPLLETEKQESSEPEWLRFDETPKTEDDSETVSVSPIASTLLRGMVSDAEPPKSAKALKEYYQQQGKMIRWIFSGLIDPLLGWYGRGVTADENFEVKRSESDWILFEDASANCCEYHCMSVPVTPDVVMAGTVATFYAPVLAKISRRRDPSRPSLFKRWRQRRAMRKALKSKKEVEE